MQRRIFATAFGLCLALIGAASAPVIAASAFVGFETKSGGFHYAWSVDQPTEKGAISQAMKSCEKVLRQDKEQAASKCKVLSSTKNAGGFVAVFHSDGGAAVAFGFSGDRQEAIDLAYQRCLKTGEKCPNTAAHVFEQTGAASVQKVAQNSNGNCQPPAGKTLRYSDSCSNGNCIRTFENGCKRQFQAPYCYDALQQRWDWKPNGC